MTAGAETGQMIADDTTEVAASGLPVERKVSAGTLKVFWIWTGLWWGGVGVLGALFFLGALDYTTSTKASLYGISIWLNGWIIPLFPG
jgi:hypothetical protein